MFDITEKARNTIIKIIFFIFAIIVFSWIYDYFETKEKVKKYEEEQKKNETLNVNNNQNINEIKKRLPDTSDIIARRKLLTKIYQ